METLQIAQTIFYFVTSVAVLVIGILLVIVIYHMIGIVSDAHKLTDDLTNTYTRTKGKIKKIISKIKK